MQPEPEGFEQNCRKAGKAWLALHADSKRPHDYWTEFKPQLAAAFGDLCAYTTVFEPMGTIDHFISWDSSRAESPHLAYEWSNFRYASAWINSSKRDAQVLDPFEVQDTWFEISLPDLQLHLTDHVPPEFRDLANFTFKRLPIAHDERIIRVRQQWYQEYLTGQISLAYLEKKAPLIARAVRKQQKYQNNSQIV